MPIGTLSRCVVWQRGLEIGLSEHMLGAHRKPALGLSGGTDCRRGGFGIGNSTFQLRKWVFLSDAEKCSEDSEREGHGVFR